MDNRLTAERLRFPRFAAQDGEMLAFAHIPTGTHHSQKKFQIHTKGG
jgi:hypothetical protein